MDYVVISAYNT